jgi:hypothetical protein
MINPYGIAATLGAIGFYWIGRLLAVGVDHKKSHLLLAISVVCAIPGFLISAYYLHLFDDWLWFYRFRAIEGSELTAVGFGLLPGLMSNKFEKWRNIRLFSSTGISVIVALIVFLPYSKPLIYPTDFQKMADQNDGVVCLQSLGYTCGAASAVTILRFYGMTATEKEIAKEYYTYQGGTEIWYIIRALTRRGLKPEPIIHKNGSELPYPSIAGVLLGSFGHFISVLDEIDGVFTLGDPLVGLRKFGTVRFFEKYHCTGFFLKVSK